MVAIPQQALLSLSTGAAKDPFFSSVALLMGFEGANLSTGAPGMNDEGPAAQGTAVVTGGAKISTAQFPFGTSSLALNGSSDWISYSDRAAWHLGAGRFTLEFRFRPANLTGTQFLVGQWENTGTLGWQLYQNGSQLAWNVSTTGSDNLVEMSGGTLVANTWLAAGIDYDLTKYRLYLGGVMVGSSLTPRNIFASSRPLTIGASALGSFTFNGFLKELRLTPGVARYASDSGYTLPAAAFPRS